MAIEINDKEATYSVAAEQDDAPVRGNAMSTEDPEADRAYEDEILARLDRGDVWAWAEVTVTAHWRGFVGKDHLCGCSYKDEADFVRCHDYYDDMRREAFAALEREVNDIDSRIHGR